MTATGSVCGNEPACRRRVETLWRGYRALGEILVPEEVDTLVDKAERCITSSAEAR